MLKTILMTLSLLLTFKSFSQELSTYKPLAQSFLSDLSINSAETSPDFDSFILKSELEFALFHGGNLPTDPTAKEEALNTTYQAIEAEFATNLNSIKSAFEQGMVDPKKAEIKSIHIGEFQVVKSNKSTGFASPVPKDQEIHVELFSILVLAEDPDKSLNKILFKLSCLNTNGDYSVMSVEQSAGNFTSRQSTYSQLPNKLIKVLVEHPSNFLGLKEAEVDSGVFNSSVQLSPEGKTLLIDQDNIIPEFKVEAVLVDNIPEADIAGVIDEVLATLAIENKGKVINTMQFTKKKVEYELSYQMKSYTNLAFDEAQNKLIKNLYFYYTLNDSDEDSVRAELVISQNEDGKGKISLVLGG